MKRCRSVAAALVACGAAMMMCAATALAAPLTLSEAIARALAFSPSIDAAAIDLSAAKSRAQFAPLLPALSASTEYNQAPGYNPVISNRGLSSALIGLDYTAWDWGRRQADWRAARYASEAAALGVSAARARTVFQTANAYYQLVRARDTEVELNSSLDRLNRYVAIIENLRRSGRAIQSNVLRIETTRDSAALALETARSNRARASAALGALIGEFGQDDIQIEDVKGIPPVPSGEIAAAPAIEAAHRAILAARAQVRAAEVERLPTFTIALTTGFLGVDPPATIAHNYGASYDGVISMPLFQGGLIRAHIDEAKAGQHSALAALRETEYLLKTQLDDASLRYRDAGRALALVEHAQPTADAAFALAWTRFLGGGTATMLEVVDAYQQAEQLRVTRYDQQYAAREAAAEVAMLYGRVAAP
jgi:outer membrane protein TolC